MSDGAKYGSGLTPEQRLARLEQIVIAKSIGTAKGQLVGFDAAGQPIAIPAAPGNGYGLTSDTSQTGGVKWGLRSRRILAMQGVAFVSGLSTTVLVVGPGATRSLSGCGDAPFFRYTASEWTVGGVAPTFVLDSTYMNNSTAPGVTCQANLSILTGLSGASGSLGISVDSTATISNAHSAMALGSASHLLSSGVTLSDGNLYAFTLKTSSGSQAAASAMNLTVKLYAVYPE